MGGLCISERDKQTICELEQLRDPLIETDEILEEKDKAIGVPRRRSEGRAV
jgi:hypothetical protein